MSSPSSVVAGNNNAPAGVREGTRVILREITANLQNSTPGTSPRRKTGNEASSSSKADNSQSQHQHQQPQQQQHDVKVRFIREFADATSTSPRVERIPDGNSLSSASSFQSLASTLSSKCSSGICVDSSPSKNADRSYLSTEISGLDELISACSNIRLDEPGSRERSFDLRVDSEGNESPDETFASAADRSSLDRTRDNSPLIFGNANDGDTNEVIGKRRTPSPLIVHERSYRSPGEIAEVSSTTIENAPDCNLNVTTDLESAKSPIVTSEADFNLNITSNLTSDNSPVRLFEATNVPDLNATRDLTGDKTAIGDRQRADFNVSTSRENEDHEVIDDDADLANLNVTRDLGVNRNKDSLDATRIISEEDSSTLRCTGNTELDSTRIIAEAFDQSCENELGTVNAATQIGTKEEQEEITIEGKSRLCEVKNSIVKPEEIVHNSRVEENFAGYEEYPLESITPSISHFHENLCPIAIEEGTKSRASTIVKDLSTIEEIETSLKLADLPRVSGITENSQLPGLPSLSSIGPIANLEVTANRSSRTPSPKLNPENATLPVRSTTPSDEKHEASLVPIVSPATPKEELAHGDSPPKIEESASVPSLLDISIGIRDVKASVLVASPSNENLRRLAENRTPGKEEIIDGEFKSIPENPLSLDIANPLTATIEKPSTPKNEDPLTPKIEDLINPKLATDSKSEQFFSDKTRPGDGQILSARTPSPNSYGTNEAEIEKESFPGDKRDNSNEDLDTTVTAEEATADENDAVSAIGEPEKYTDFAPQRQSTALVPQPKLETQISRVIAASERDDNNFIFRPISVTDDYSAFLPQKQSTALDQFTTSPLSSKLHRQRTSYVTALAAPEEASVNGTSPNTTPSKRREIVLDRCNFAQLELAANSVANDIFNSSLELAEDNERFVSAEAEIFHDATNFDFLLSKTPRKNAKSNLREVSLYVKFDPLVSNTSMLPQGNIQSASPPVNNEARNGENNGTTITSNVVGTPKRNPAIAAIDRLLFYSPMSTNTTPANTNIQKTNDAQEKLKAAEETSEATVNMAKELELVRTTVLQLEEQLEKLKLEHEEALEQQASYKEKINQLQAQLAQEIKHKNEITVVVDEYEISISRLVAERERDRKNLDLEKAKLQEELAAAKHHLDNTEAAFNDVHLKYERLKAVVATYKNNEAALKESLQENVEIIKSLENRYEQVKSHATARLEKANHDLEEIRKQNESETVKLRAMLRKAELKSNSLAELVEQKTKENKELAGILDEVIARVGCNKAE